MRQCIRAVHNLFPTTKYKHENEKHRMTTMEAEIRREMNHAGLAGISVAGVPNGVALSHSGQSGTKRFVRVSCADGTDSAVTVKSRVCTTDLYKHWIANSYPPSTEQMSLIERRHRRFLESVHARRAWFWAAKFKSSAANIERIRCYLQFFRHFLLNIFHKTSKKL